eukprot:COSAG04_NODE_27784_length_280_cov_0.569061_1_plen_36_part_10
MVVVQERVLLFGENKTLSDTIVRDEAASSVASAPRF